MPRLRITTASAGLLEAALVVALIGAALFGLIRTVLSPVAFGERLPNVVRDVGARVLGDRYFGEAPAVRAELRAGVMVTTSPQLYVYGGKSVPPGRGEFSGPFEAQVNAYAPSATQRFALLAGGLVESLAAMLTLLLLLLIVRSLRQGDPFVSANAARLRLIAAAVAIGGTGASALHAWGAYLVLDDSAISPLVQQRVRISPAPLAAGLGFFLLAEVFRRGALMRDDLEGLV